MKLYMKLTQHAKQSQLVPLSGESWLTVLSQAQTNYKKQKTFEEPFFIVQLHMYAAKEARQGIRRATPARIAAAATAIDS
ncbi:hypothetical protein GN958_ATG03441 [Phytophthora infestans]|uniref:Uncharacterized protein n=1 Tax=Phytophthora infestans TaxID=4787 RepID=A0A8S9U8C9_PHYIN|nr:hypothetical protein GN958_ATG22484 [Phytophthora infestans]KAF4130845.1 hypothetical protein GN958_ATG19974 [Phytophthora infestans]KAF4132523.1 hypothetical protein GN958_ATG18288 [Phytophthora infestans]KAF4133076.1 hypothetical protein GN958_ATG17736 [Phytophthora infestans]KAF4133130.1 hypothetical protein GN958_ATG17672 [Phytophthora infestans]